jgi:transcriptional regulator GlxA family with amidase domain
MNCEPDLMPIRADHRDHCRAAYFPITGRLLVAAQSKRRSDMSLFNVGFVIFPDLTQLDFTGPQQVLARLPLSAMHIVAKSAAPVPSDSGLSLVPTHTFANCPRLDLICIPGGISGVVEALSDRDTIQFIRRQASST